MYCSAFCFTLVPLLLAGCVWPLPIGPGPVTVATEDVCIASVPEEMLFGKPLRFSEPPKTIKVIQFDLSSDVDLHQHFKRRIMQVRCDVDGNTDHIWSNFGHGPFYAGVDLSSLDYRDQRVLVPRAHDGRYAYTVYAFAGLSASWLEDGHAVRHTDLDPLHFSHLSCFIIGVTMAPVLFPQSNEFVLSRDQFIALLSERRAAAPLSQPIETDRDRRASPACSSAHGRR